MDTSWTGPVHRRWFESIRHAVVGMLENVTVLLLLVFELTAVLMLEMFYLEDQVSSQDPTPDTMSRNKV